MKTQTLFAAFAMTVAAGIVAPMAQAQTPAPAAAPAPAAPAATPAPAAAKPMAHHATKPMAHHMAMHPAKAPKPEAGDAAVDKLNQQQLDKNK